jgi:Tat protein secretion system quality control protein TatD with DNase activity
MSGGCGVDRGGGRESKSHDRRTKRGNLAKANPFTGQKAIVMPNFLHSPAAPGLSAPRDVRSLIDCGSNLISRQLAREHNRMLTRAQAEHVDACITFCSDFDRIDELVAMVRAHGSFLYSCIGIHPDNVKRSHDKTFATKVQQLKAFALTPECVAIYAGFDGTRDIAALYPQQKLLQDQLQLAAEIHLPVVLQVIGAPDRVCEILAEHTEAAAAGTFEASALAAGPGGSGPGAAAPAPAAAAGPPWVPRFAVMGFDGFEKGLEQYLAAGCHIILDGAVCDPTSEEGERLRELMPKIPLSRLLIGSNAPLRTPQNIADHVIKTSRNEPSNLPALLPVLLEAYAAAPPASLGRTEPLTLDALSGILYDNAVAFFRLSGEHFDAAAAAEAAAGSGAGGAGAAASASGKGGKGKKPSAAMKQAKDGKRTGGGGGAEGAGGADEEGDDDEEDEDTEGEEGDAVGELPSSAAAAGGASSGRYMTASAAAAAAAASEKAAALAPVAIEYRCRMCRFPLFTDSDVMPHDGRSIRPSSRTLANVRAEAEESAQAEAAAASAAARKAAKAAGGAAGGKDGKAGGPAAGAASGKDKEKRGGKKDRRRGGGDSDDEEGEEAAAPAAGKGAAGTGKKGGKGGRGAAADAAPAAGGKKKGGKGRRGRGSGDEEEDDAEASDDGTVPRGKGGKAAAAAGGKAGKGAARKAGGGGAAAAHSDEGEGSDGGTLAAAADSRRARKAAPAPARGAGAGAAKRHGRDKIVAEAGSSSEGEEHDHDHDHDHDDGASSGGEGGALSRGGSDDEDDDGEDGDGIGALPSAGALKGRSGGAGGAAGGDPYAAPRPRPKFADGATVIDTGDGLAEVAVGRWHTAKGRTVKSYDEGVCRMFLVDCLSWMDNASQAEPEGALLCPGCRTKVGLYALGGLKCSCGLAVSPGFKIPKQKVDAILHGVDSLEVALAAASMEERGGELGGLVAAARPGEAPRHEEDEEEVARKREKSGLRVPVSKHRGNFSRFRDQVTIKGFGKIAAELEKAVEEAGAKPGAVKAGKAGRDRGEDGESGEEAEEAAATAAAPAPASAAAPPAAGAAAGKRKGGR